MAIAFKYGKTQLGKKAYNLFINTTSNFGDALKEEILENYLLKFVPGDSVVAVGSLVDIDDDSPSVIIFNSSSNTTVTFHVQLTSRSRCLINIGTGVVTTEVGTTIKPNVPYYVFDYRDAYEGLYLPIGYCESGISFNITQGDSTKASTGQEFVTSENIEMNANVYGLDDYIRTLINTLQTNASIGMVSQDGTGIFVKNIVPFADIMAISNDQNMTKLTIKKENPVIEVV